MLHSIRSTSHSLYPTTGCVRLKRKNRVAELKKYRAKHGMAIFRGRDEGCSSGPCVLCLERETEKTIHKFGFEMSSLTIDPSFPPRECLLLPQHARQKAPTLQRATSNASLQSNTTGASKETRGTSARGGTDAATGGGTVAALGTTTPAAGGQARRVRGGSAAGAGGVNGTASRVLMPSTNMQLSNAFHVCSFRLNGW